jgi:peptidyl-prolyl cis-trans isomerase-like 1
MSVQGFDVTIETNLGALTVELYWDHAPKVRQTLAKVRQLRQLQTCKNFAELAKKGYYNGVIFHRIIPVCTAPGFPWLLD